MRQFQAAFGGGRGTNLFVEGWEPEEPKAVVALFHGLGEHIGRYSHLAHTFCQEGYSLVGLDLRGHGRSGGKRGHSPGYETLLDDIDGFLRLLRERYPRQPFFLYGHSLGGNLVLNHVLRRKPDLQGVIATSPWLKLAYELQPSRLFFGRLMKRVLPALTQASGLEVEALSRDSAVVQAYRDDPLVHDRVSVGHGLDIYAAGLWALEHAQEFSLPLLIMQGTADRITSIEASRQFVEKVKVTATFHSWVGCYHEVHNEPQKAEILRTMIDWMEDRLKEYRSGLTGSRLSAGIQP